MVFSLIYSNRLKYIKNRRFSMNMCTCLSAWCSFGYKLCCFLFLSVGNAQTKSEKQVWSRSGEEFVATLCCKYYCSTCDIPKTFQMFSWIIYLHLIEIFQMSCVLYMYGCICVEYNVQYSALTYNFIRMNSNILLDATKHRHA